jgi:uncharacterized protein
MTETFLGSIASLWRYPVKSMIGEQLGAARIDRFGLFGDRAYALLDCSDGKIATAKNPRKWPRLFEFRAAVAEGDDAFPAVRITLPDGATVSSDLPEIHRILSLALQRDVKLESVARRRGAPAELAGRAMAEATSEEYWPDIEGLEQRDTVTDFGLPEGSFCDSAYVHLLTTATLESLRALYPEGRFEIPRFRPNLVVETKPGENGFVENDWIGKTLAVGDSVRLSVTGPCPRCVMTTLPQGDLPRDIGILRTAVRHNRGAIGVYASVLRGGQIRRGDSIKPS